MGFKMDQIKNFGIKKVTRSRKEDTFYLHMDNESLVSQIFRRAAVLGNKDIRISHYIALREYQR